MNCSASSALADAISRSIAIDIRDDISRGKLGVLDVFDEIE